MSARPSGRDPRPARVAWHRRLTVRLPILLGLTLLGFDLLGGRLYEAVFGLFGLPDRNVAIVVDEPLGSTALFSITGGPESESDRASAGPDSPAPSPGVGLLPGLRTGPGAPRRDPATLLEDAARAGPGRWYPTPAALERWRSDPGSPDFLWTSADLEVLATSPDLVDLVGTIWSPVQPPASPFDLTPPLLESSTPVRVDGELAGWFVRQRSFEGLQDLVSAEMPELLSEALPFDSDGPPEVMNAVEFEQLNRRQRWIAQAVSYGAILGFALLIGALLSRLVTARLERLSAIAALPPDSAAEPLTPVAGGDEIAVLGRGLVAARSRVSELIETLEQRDARRREWVAQVAHDLRTPMTALLACLDRAERSSGDPAALTETLAGARQDVARVCDLTEDLLEAARLEAGAELVLEPVLPGELVERTARLMDPVAEARGLRIERAIPPDLPTLEADGRGLARVLENLLRNAVRHAEACVTVAAEPHPTELWLTVTDDGPGFAAGAHQRDADSAGLGLQIVDRLVAAHGGTLDVSDPPAGGARVRVRLPLDAGRADHRGQ